MTYANINELLTILKITKSCEVEQLPEHLQEVVSQIMADSDWTIQEKRDGRIAVAMETIRQGCNAETVIQYLTWKDFEGFIAQVLGEHEYVCTESYRKKGNSTEGGMEIDVIGVKGNSVLVIDAKMWGIRKGKTSAIKEAALKQMNRARRLSNDLQSLTRRFTTLNHGTYFLRPIVVTWIAEDVEIHEGVPVVPIFKLNSFLQELTRFEDHILTFTGEL